MHKGKYFLSGMSHEIGGDFIVMPIDAQPETLGFQTEITQLLDLMIHSLYSNKDIFLRELISNASDAIDRLRFAALSDDALAEHDTDYAIHVSYDKEARTITIADNGIGMSRAEVVEHIGTIAKSGTREFFQALTGDQQKDARLIGQFGVGFYSAFVVADHVTLSTRHAGLAATEGARWESDGRGTYTLETIEKASRGTEVVLHLRDGEDDFLSGTRLRDIIRQYSDHIGVPIFMPRESGDEGGEEQVNQAVAFWTRPKSTLSEQEYAEFYEYLTHDFDAPLTYVHSRMEGTQEYTLLLYVPARAPFDLWDRDHRHGVKLYVQRVFILDDAEHLLPRYLRFIRGVIDSDDLPLNVSRELLQQNKLIDQMRANAVKKVLGALNDLATNQTEKYATFWREFGQAFKEGVAEDSANRDAITPLLRFASTASDEQTVSLDTYVKRMKTGQDKIYFLTAESFDAAKYSPLLEVFRQKGVEVLLLAEPVDYVIGSELREFQGTPLQPIAQGTVDLSHIPLDEEAQKQQDEQPTVANVQDFLNKLKDALHEQVKEVRASTRLTSSPACLVADEHDLDPNLQRLLEANGRHIPLMKPILEVNPHHALILKLSQDVQGEKFAEWAQLLYEQSVLVRGDRLDNPSQFVTRLNTLLMQP